MKTRKPRPAKPVEQKVDIVPVPEQSLSDQLLAEATTPPSTETTPPQPQ